MLENRAMGGGVKEERRMLAGFEYSSRGGSAQWNAPVVSLSSVTWHAGGYVALPVDGRIFANASVLYGEAFNTVKRTQQRPSGAREEGAGAFKSSHRGGEGVAHGRAAFPDVRQSGVAA